MNVDPRLTAALTRQLERRDELLAAGATRIGWKLGMGAAEAIGDAPAVGHLTSATRIDGEKPFEVAAAVDLHADAEIAVTVGRAVEPDADSGEVGAAIAGFAAAVELVDLGPPADAETIVATNIFHRGFAIGTFRPRLDAAGGRLIVDEQVSEPAPVADDLVERLRAAALVLASVDEELAAGDIVITGSVVQVPLVSASHVVADFGALGRARVTLRPRGS